MRSMTGYGTSEYTSEKLRATVDLKAYNNKYLDIALNMPTWLTPLEPKIRGKVKDAGILRGRVDLNIRIKELEEDLKVTIDHGVVKEVVKSLQEVIELSGIDSTITLSDVMGIDGVLKTEKTRDLEQFWSVIEPLMDSVLNQFIEEKITEGRQLEEDIFGSLDLIRDNVNKITSYVPSIEEKIKKSFNDKFTEVLGHELDENRVLTELGVLLVKYDINEEIVRLNSHIENFKKSSLEMQCGKKLDFICQEMNREINTIGSKSPIIEISQLVVDMKNSLEQVREQARNVE